MPAKYAIILYIRGERMTEDLKLFEGKKIRHIYNEEKEIYYFSVVDVVAILIEKDYQTARKYWNKLAQRLRNEGSEQTVTNCHQLKMEAQDGKMRQTDVADIRTMFRDRKSTRLNSSHSDRSRMPSSA